MDTNQRLYVQQFASDKGESVHLEHEPRELLRACHLSGQIDADQAVAHYRAGELPITMEEPAPSRLVRFIVAAICAFVFVSILLALGPGGVFFNK